jgi:hypothetical protein
MFPWEGIGGALIGSGEAIAGAANSATVGISGKTLDAIGININRCSTAYRAGEFAPIPSPGKGISLGAKVFRAVGGTGRGATKGADDVARRTVTALTREQDAGLRAALRDPNKFRHVFDNPGHKLDPLVRELGSREAVLREAVLAVPRSQKGIFEVTTQVGRHNLTVRGRVADGVPQIGTVFLP